MKRYVKAYKEIKVSSEKLNETSKVLYSATNKSIVISHYWERNEVLVPYQGRINNFSDQYGRSVEIVEHCYDLKVGNTIISDICIWNLIIDGKEYPEEVDNYREANNILYVDTIVGGG